MAGKIEAILIDVDGCVVPANGQVYFNGFYGGLERLADFVQKANNGKFPPISFCTGRDRNYVEAVSSLVGRPNSWSVVESGIALFNPAVKQEVEINPSLTPKKRKVFEEIRKKRVPEILQKYHQFFLYPGNIICIALERKKGIQVSIEALYEVILEEMADLIQEELVAITHSDCAIDISPAGIDKASGLRFFSSYTDTNLKNIIGIGDSKGDFPFLQKVGYVGCPCNASDECKNFVRKREKKGFISRYAYTQGVIEVIQHFRGIGRSD